jgi:hypothetical protein
MGNRLIYIYKLAVPAVALLAVGVKLGLWL